MAKPKQINFTLIPAGDEYRLLDRAREYHPELNEARIALAWRDNLKADADGHLVLGKCVKISDLHKEVAEWDFVILINREVWQSGKWTDREKLALLDHELSHAAAAYRDDGEPKRDERGRIVWRIRKHDIEEFHGVIARHGLYKRDLEKFAAAILEAQLAPLLQASSEPIDKYMDDIVAEMDRQQAACEECHRAHGQRHAQDCPTRSHQDVQ